MVKLQRNIDYLRRHKAAAEACIKGQDNGYVVMIKKDLLCINFLIKIMEILEELDDEQTISL